MIIKDYATPVRLFHERVAWQVKPSSGLGKLVAFNRYVQEAAV